MIRILKGATNVVIEYKLPVPSLALIHITPLEAFIHTILLACMYSIILTFIMYVMNMKIQYSGTVIALLFHIVSMLMCFSWVFMRDFSKWSFFKNAVFPVFYSANQSIVFSYSYMLVMLTLIFIYGNKIMETADFYRN